MVLRFQSFSSTFAKKKAWHIMQALHLILIDNFLMVQTGIQSANKERVIQLIAEQLKALAIGAFEDDLVANVKSSLINNFESRLDNQMTAVNRAQNDILTGTYVSSEDWIQNVLSVSKAEIMEVASKAKLQNIYFLDGGN